MKAFEKKISGIYIPGYQQSGGKKFDYNPDEMILDVLDTDEDRIMYSNNSSYGRKTKSVMKQHSKNRR
jgi:hypothetical protein